MSVTVPVVAVKVSLIQPPPGVPGAYVALHPAAVTLASVVKVMSMLPLLDVKTGGREEPLKEPSRGEDVVGPLYTLTKSYPDSVANEVNVRAMVPPPDGCISLLHNMLLP